MANDPGPRLSPKLHALNTFLDTPPTERDAWVRMAARVPDDCPGGLRALVKTPAQQAAIYEAGCRFNRYCRSIDPNETRQGCWLSGPDGSGKSAVLGALAYDLRHQSGAVPFLAPEVAYPHSSKHVEAIYWNAAEMFRRAKKIYQDESCAADLEEAREARVLILDQLHLLPLPAWGHPEWAALIELRYANGRPTCYGAQETADALEVRIHESALTGETLAFAVASIAKAKVRSNGVEVPLGAAGSWHARPAEKRERPAPFFTTWPDRREVLR